MRPVEDLSCGSRGWPEAGCGHSPVIWQGQRRSAWDTQGALVPPPLQLLCPFQQELS